MRHTQVGTRWLCALTILCALAFPLTSRAQARLSGRVLAGESGRPLANAIVLLRNVADSSRELSDTTSASGEYRFNVPIGYYSVSASLGDRGRARAEVALVDAAETVVDLALAPESPAFVGARVPLLSSRYFNLTEPNYFISGFEDFTGKNPVPAGAYANQVKFHIALRYRLLTVFDSLHDSGLHVAYRQNSFWHLWEQSAPFFDNDYNPSMFVYYDSRDYSSNAFMPSLRAFVQHESNGRDGLASRSWNNYGLGLDFGDYNQTLLYGGVRGWQAFSVAPENSDILDFVGRGEIDVSVQPLLWRGLYLGDLGFAARLRVDGQTFWTNQEWNLYVGSRVLSWIPGLSSISRLNASVMIQRFSGTGEDLLTFRQKRTVTRIGLATVR